MERRPRLWRSVRGGFLLAYLIWGLAISLAASSRTLGAPAITIAFLIAFGCFYLLLRGAVGAPFLLGCALIAGTVAESGESALGTILVLVMLVAPFQLPWRRAALVAGPIVGFMAVTHSLTPLQAIFLGWVFLMSTLVRGKVTLARDQWAEKERSDQAVIDERRRLAREIHDVLAHSLSGQIAHLEATRLLLQQKGDTELVLDRVVMAGELARRGLEEARQAVEILRGSQEPLIVRLEKLVTEFHEATGTPCSLILQDSHEVRLAPEVALALVRTAQEALSNVRKHAPDAEVSMTFTLNDGWAELEVRDTGSPDCQHDAKARHGYGLLGLHERAELVGGELEAGPDGAGFRVRLRVPA
ncbi:sensor histidine kinase [Lentzea kentuckyensis]|uniref:sensor histidine kinase n=1 Tax=Lentzea kentuckyensis TaxID=360086 RepID=UPI000A3AA05E|nr:histidine kinase [Lentzea kentuckyensis]